MDLSLPPAVRESLERIRQALADVSVKDELAACEATPELWRKGDQQVYEPVAGPLAQVTEFRALGAYALPLPELLTRARRGYVPLADGAVALGWPDASAPWAKGDPLTLELREGKLHGRVTVAPFCVPARGLVALASSGSEVALVESRQSSHTEKAGDAFLATFEGAEAKVLKRGDEAEQAWQKAVLYERQALVGLTLGVI